MKSFLLPYDQIIDVNVFFKKKKVGCTMVMWVDVDKDCPPSIIKMS